MPLGALQGIRNPLIDFYCTPCAIQNEISLGSLFHFKISFSSSHFGVSLMITGKYKPK